MRCDSTFHRAYVTFLQFKILSSFCLAVLWEEQGACYQDHTVSVLLGSDVSHGNAIPARLNWMNFFLTQRRFLQLVIAAAAAAAASLLLEEEV